MVIAIIQARMGSTRLPGKVLTDVYNKPLLSYQLDRIKLSKKIDKIVIATSNKAQDKSIVDFCSDYGIECFRGSENDVLARYYECAKLYNPSTVVRLTADCPLIDPEIIDKTIQLFYDNLVDYACNTVPPETSKFPDGSDVEVFSFNALEKAFLECNDPHFREHVTFYFWQGTAKFKTIQLSNKADWSKYRFTVDYPEDLEVVKYIFGKLNDLNLFGNLEQIIQILNENPEIQNKNGKYYFGIGWNK